MEQIDRSLTYKRSLGMGWRYFPKSSNRRVILIYHSVGTGTWSLSIDKFKEQMIWLLRNAQVVAIDYLLKQLDLPGLHVALTFDDGYRSLYNIVKPILKEMNFSATVYLNAGMISDDIPRLSDQSLGYYPGEEFLIWQEVKELRDAGWTIGSHGIEHTDLKSLSMAEIERQIIVSKRDIESHLDQPCDYFSYPWGGHNKKVHGVLSNAGYQYAVTGEHRPLSLSDNPVALPRLDIRSDYCLNDFVAVVRGDWDYLGIIQGLKKQLFNR